MHKQTFTSRLQCVSYRKTLLPSALARGNINRSILGIYVRTYVRSSAQARTSRRSLRRHRRLDVYARARIQYRLYRRTLALGACETRIIAFEPITQDRLAAS